MLRSFLSLALLVLLTSCSTTNNSLIDHGNIIPESKISGKSVEPTIIDDGKLNIAILVPLSKQKEQISKFLIKSAQLALVQSHNANINLLVFDSNMIENDPHLLETQLLEKNIKVIIGPVFAAETEKLASLLTDRDITILSFSNDSSITNNSLLTLGVSPDSQANILTSYAISQGVQHFYLLLPSTKYGKSIYNAVGNIVSTKDQAAFTTNWYSTENVNEVMSEFIKSIEHKDLTNSVIFMPQAGSNINRLNALLEQHNLNIRLMGGQAWEQTNILKLPKFDRAILIRHNLIDQKFYNDFNKFYRIRPTNLDIIAYNALLMISNMEKNNLPINKRSIIENNQEFGKYSEVKFTPEGLSIYKTSIVEVHDHQFKTMANYQ